MSEDEPTLFDGEDPPELDACPVCGTRSSKGRPHGEELCAVLADLREFARRSFARVEWPADSRGGSVATTDSREYTPPRE